jgi:hydrogenase maturation factor
MMATVDTTLPAGQALLAEDLAAAALSLARCFAAGATMWCVSTQWPAHGRHVAVEFVHPVIVGKRALPAVDVEAGDVADSVRLLARPGDVLLAVSTATDARTVDLLRRSEAWGLTRIWMATGPHRPVACAEHVVWMEAAEPGVAARSGDLVLLYHLLWELTHVVFEHPGLLTGEPPCADAVCITCSDTGEIAEVRSVDGADIAEVLVRGVLESVDVSLVDPVARGDLLVVHAGVAITALTEPLP